MHLLSHATAAPFHTPQRVPALGERRIRLRAATAARHRALERAVERRNYFADQTGYSIYIRQLCVLYSILEPALERMNPGQLLPDWPYRRKLAALADDLAILSGPGRAEFPKQATLAHPGVNITCSGSCLGMLYVIEGSTLGGALLARRASQLGFTPGYGARFLNFYGDSRSTMWRGFLATLEAAPLSTCEDAALLVTAQRTFSLFYRYIGSESARRCG